jgi:exodeoxyribonuclease VII large subunit
MTDFDTIQPEMVMSQGLDSQPGDNTPAFSVTELSMAIRRTVEGAFGRVRLRAEISRPTYARSGHLYVTLKDDKSVIDGVCWKGTVGRLSLRVEEGMEVFVSGKITTYPGSSKYQIVIDQIELAGEGALLKLLEDRKHKLAEEGLFDPDRKQPLPYLPNRIAVVTSPTGAVIRDILHRISDRFPGHVLVWPTQVQGQGAAEKIATAINALNALPEAQAPDLIIVARGGGSLEDLWCFNEEVVVRAAAASHIPLISAVGHETDTTLIDYAADVRAPTPTAAAELAVPVRVELVHFLADLGHRNYQAFARKMATLENEIGFLSRALGDPRRRLEDLTIALDDRAERLHRAGTRFLADKAGQVRELYGRLRRPDQVVAMKQESLEALTHRLAQSTNLLFRPREQQLTALGSLLDGFHKAIHLPLENGYAMVRTPDGKTMTSAVHAGAEPALTLQFADGEVSVSTRDTPVPATPQAPPQTTAQPAAKRKTASKPDDKRQGQLL